MKTKNKIRISITIMIIAIMLGIYSIIISQTDIYNISVLIFLIGITISGITTNQLLKKYRKAYGDIEEDN